MPIGERTKKVDVQIIFATNVDLKKLVEKGKFREDLYYRISALELRIPPLRERKEEILPLFKYFLRKNVKKEFHGEIEISEEMEEFLLNYSWPGNVRQLENLAIYLAVILDPNNKRRIELRDLPRNILEDIHKIGEKIKASESEPVFDMNKRLEDLERGLIRKALIAAEGNKSKAAELLGVSRVTLMKKLKKYGLL